MASEFRLPALGADMDEGTIVQWNVAPGSVVKRGDVVAVVETDKGAIDVEIFQDGVVREIVVQPGTKVPVGTVLAMLEGAAEPSASVGQSGAADGSPPPPVIAPAADAPSPVQLAATGARLKISPAARKRASELGIDAATLQGSGPGGVITLEDVEHSARPTRAKAEEAAEPKAGEGMREAIAAAMSRSKREIPHYYLSHEIDLQTAHDRLSAINAARTPDLRLLMGALLVRATVRALAKVPELNGRFETEPYAPTAEVNCGIAVAMRGGR